MIKYFLLLFFFAFSSSLSSAKDVPDLFGILNERVISKIFTAEQEKELQQIIDRHDILTEGKTTGDFCWGGVTAEFLITHKGKYYALNMMSSHPPIYPYTFILYELKIDGKNNIHYCKGFKRIFEDRQLYKELFQALKKFPQMKLPPSYWEKLEE